jgi:hypothetical protein
MNASPLRSPVWMLATVVLFAGCDTPVEQSASESPVAQVTPEAPVEQAASDQPKPDISWLFVANATGGTFVGKTVTMHNVPPPLIFSDRPYRIWGHMALAELLPKVKEGENSFIDNPPNAVLSTFREGELPTEATVVMHDAMVDGTSLSFTVDVLDGAIPETFGPASLFVDSHLGAFIVGAAVANASNENETERVVVREPTYVYHVDPAPAAPAQPSAQSRLAEAKRLFEQGLISEEEYADTREQILATM